MESRGGKSLSAAEAINRGYNMLGATVLGIVALAFGSVIFEEADSIDKVDNSLLVIVGVAAVVWYFLGDHWVQRSRMPIVFAGLALISQIIGIAIESGDPAAFGDDIGGMGVFLPLIVIMTVLYGSNGRLMGAEGGTR